jgi:hypothetical protein
MFDELMASWTCLPELFTTSQRPVYKSPRRIASKFAGCCLRLCLVGTLSSEPSIGSSLKVLRKTPWAREKVDGLYLFMCRDLRRAGPPRLAG